MPPAQRMAADPAVLPLAPPNETGQHNRTVDNVNGRPTGNTAAYHVRRLNRDAPDVAALERGLLFNVTWAAADGARSTWMQWLLTAHVHAYRRRHGGSGHVCRGRLGPSPIEQDGTC